LPDHLAAPPDGITDSPREVRIMSDKTVSTSLRTDAAPFGRTEGSGPEVSSFALDNGLKVVVIPDRRVPVATHMVWYRNGSADDPLGQSGIAHFLEHLMFKGTDKHPAGEFSQVVSALGGQENAFTSFDYTAYFQRVAKEHLKTMMAFEADRMSGLVLDDAVVAPERDVVLEERRMRVETDPAAQLSEAMATALFVHHPYGIPIIGWMHEIETLDRDHALGYYRRFYTPENAILVVAGDVGADEVRRLAEATYGKVPSRGEMPIRRRPREPEPRAARHVCVADPKVEQPTLQRLYLTPSCRTAAGREALGLELLAEVIGGGPTSYFYRKLVLERGIAVNAGSWYMGSAMDDTRFSIYAVRPPAWGSRPSRKPSTRSSPGSPTTLSTPKRSIGPRRGSWPRRSMRATARARSPASTAPRSPSARPSRKCAAGRPKSKRCSGRSSPPPRSAS
jgi:zinc protease